ncbi:MAG: hypothetical protein K2Q14_01565, partial [Gammaproteobacteria bacterium]|nr:hypothetical protein [Gammaproteobacteria bacterium]
MARKKDTLRHRLLNGLMYLALGIMHGLALLPRCCKRGLQRLIAWILFHKRSEMREVAEQNIAACFPELDEKAQKKLLKDSLSFLASTLVEGLNMPWPSKTNIFPSIGNIKGLEHIEAALANKQGVLLLFPHFLAVYLVGFLLIPRVNFPFSLMYHSPKNKVLATFFEKHINRYCSPAFTRKHVRQMVAHLRAGNVVWYAPDLEPNKIGQAVFAPFFGLPAATYTTTARIAELSGAAVIPIAFYRRDNEAVFDVIFHPKLDNFPSDNPVKDA